MFKSIMVPLDLAHTDKMTRSVRAAADLGKLYGARVHLVGVTASTPGAVAHNPDEYAAKLATYAEEQSTAHETSMEHHAVLCNDPAVELDAALKKTGEELGVDLVVMASHVPGFMDHLFHSNAGHLATHTGISVFIVR